MANFEEAHKKFMATNKTSSGTKCLRWSRMLYGTGWWIKTINMGIAP